MVVLWTPMAEADLATIFDFIADDNLQAAVDMDRLLRKSGNSLAVFPYKGRLGRVAKTRELIAHPNYIVVYRIAGDSIQILSILHAAQQYPPE